MGHLRARHSRPAYITLGSSRTPFTIFGAALIHEWDLSLSTVQVSTGISSVSDLRGGKALTQGTGSKQPTWSGSGTTKYSASTAASSQHLLNSAMSYSGNFTVLIVGGFTALADSLRLFACSSNKVSVSRWGVTNWRGVFDDATGADYLVTGALVTTGTKAWALMNDTGVRRKMYIGGGAGTAGARTDDIDACTQFTLHAENAFGNYSNSTVYWAGIVAPSPSLANLNLWGAWAAARFGVTWSTAT